MKPSTRLHSAGSTPAGFEWRASVGAWRWLILGSLGVAPFACGGRTDGFDIDGPGGAGSNGGASGIRGVGGTPGIHYGTGGAGAVGGFSGRAGAGGVSGNAGTAGTGAGGTDSRPSGCYSDGVALEGGFQGCTNGMKHRASAGTCPNRLSEVDPLPEEYRALADAGVYPCTQNSDCTDQEYGRCALGQGGPYCEYGCASDADCGAEQLCLCDMFIGRCVASNCNTDADCGYGSLCGSHAACGYAQFACQTSQDECAVNSDCPAGKLCVFSADTAVYYSVDDPVSLGADPHRVCASIGCPVPGRPFLVGGAERLAPCVERRDWYSAAPREDAAALSAELRRAVVCGWTEQALMEHASVAAFARFTLQLLSLGAPAELVAGAAAAMQDEIRHARDCFSLARRYSDTDRGPGALPIEGALAETDLCAVVLTTVREGCIGETVAALEAAEALEHCEDAAARAVLERIAAEETRHAELAWRFVAWALETGPRELRQRVRATFAAEIAAVEAATPGVAAFDRELARHGLLSAPVRQILRQRVLGEVVAPCAEALLASGLKGPDESFVSARA